MVLHYLSFVLVNFLHLLPPQTFFADCLFCCLQPQLCSCCHPLHLPLALQWSWWAFWLREVSARSREHKDDTQCWTFNPIRKGGNAYPDGVKEEVGSQWRKFRKSTNCSFLFRVWSVVLSTLGDKCCLLPTREVIPCLSLSSLSLFLNLYLPFPHTAPSLLPNVTLFTIWTVVESLQLLPLLPSHFSHSNLWNAMKEKQTQVSANESKVSLQPSLTKSSLYRKRNN